MITDDNSAGNLVDTQDHCLVLLVDDDPMVAEALRLMVEGEDDLRMHYCADASTALDVAEQLKPTVILLDMVMPDIDGLTLLRYLRVSEATKSVPVLALSMKDDAKLKADIFSAGGNDYLIKLPESIELLARIRYHSQCYIRLLQRDEAFRALDISQRKLAASNIKLQQLASMDGLTGIPNRRTFQETIDTEWDRATRDSAPLSLIMMDIDFFKKCNDHYGHQHGDEVLRRVAKALSGCLKRPADMVARYGGEEFAVLLPGTDLEGAASVGEELRSTVEALHLENAKSQVCEWVTISLGVASCIPAPGDIETEQLIKQADEALYEAKEQGRNQVVKASESAEGNSASS
ncbi:diguanylate cyclase [Kistimonas asteriae]|uniref:diguanylate cyclase n=1 Tax=Kistimonas asteriae TaxID=517724 RepID=UPI0031B81500